MPDPKTQQDLISYIAELERRIAILERSAVRIVTVANRTTAPVPTPNAGRIIYDTTAGRLYAGNGSTWNALW
jgi:hypothetical protein